MINFYTTTKYNWQKEDGTYRPDEYITIIYDDNQGNRLSIDLKLNEEEYENVIDLAETIARDLRYLISQREDKVSG